MIGQAVRHVRADRPVMPVLLGRGIDQRRPEFLARPRGLQQRQDGRAIIAEIFAAQVPGEAIARLPQRADASGLLIAGDHSVALLAAGRFLAGLASGAIFFFFYSTKTI